MRFSPLFSTLIFTVSSFTRVRASSRLTSTLHVRNTPLRASMPIPFISSFFSSSSPSEKMSYPDQRTSDEWRAVLNKAAIMASVQAIRNVEDLLKIGFLAGSKYPMHKRRGRK
ncbi:hypothetical protein BN1723_011487 [Verticillium longisporum]|uniref:Uncharacterized protein n=1 Tax=Verticillium longisporum TaxID=100787 RepID=A0A0G4L8I3_VERLO|nr:hypothetical protein BN1723_011487 [Verticillium longisporum]